MVQFPWTESSILTTSSSLTVHFSAFHFFLGTKDGNTSQVQHLQKVSTIFCTNSTLCWRLLVSLNGPWGNLDEAHPKSVSLGHRYEPSFSNGWVLGRSAMSFVSVFASILFACWKTRKQKSHASQYFYVSVSRQIKHDAKGASEMLLTANVHTKQCCLEIVYFNPG